MPLSADILTTASDLASLEPDRSVSADLGALVVGLHGESTAPTVSAVGLSQAQREAIAAAAAAVRASTEVGATTLLAVPAEGLPALIIAAGVGAEFDAVTVDEWRQAAGAAARAARTHGTTLLDLGVAASDAGTDLVAEVALGAALGGYRPLTITAPSSADDVPSGDNDRLAIAGATATQIARAAAIATAVAHSRDFVNAPPNLLYPESFATAAATRAQEVGLEVEVLDAAALADGGYGGICGVGGGSSRGPRLLRLSHRAGDDRPTVALVGKGITFDTGGISLKPAAGMEQMTMDMGGAAAVIGTMFAVAALEVDCNVVATVPMAENMPSGTAYRPGDVLTMYGGTTVEITNTDAEGRLLLADAIVRACEDQPQYLIDTATLTGAAMVALGKRTPGVMGTPEFRDRVAALSAATGENGWAMPLPAELRASLDSAIADLMNAHSTRWGGMLVAAVFLQEFVADGVQWAHIDVAGPAYNDSSAYGYQPKGGTGVPLRTMLAVIEDIAARG